jgi:hypothetical protein
MNDLTAFVREHRPLTACLILMVVFGVLALTVNGLFQLALNLLVFMLSFIWLVVFCTLSLLDSYERSQQ